MEMEVPCEVKGGPKEKHEESRWMYEKTKFIELKRFFVNKLERHGGDGRSATKSMISFEQLYKGNNEMNTDA